MNNYPKWLWLIALSFYFSFSLSAQEIKELKYEEVQSISISQLQSFDMDIGDKDLLIFENTDSVYMYFTGSRWLEIGKGGDLKSVLAKNPGIKQKGNIFAPSRIPKTEGKTAIPKIKSKIRKVLLLDEDDYGLLINDGNYRVFTENGWTDLGDGGNFGAMLNRQRSVEGLKDNFKDKWVRAFGIGLTAGAVYGSYFRDNTYPSNPFLTGVETGYEVGINQNLMYKRWFQSRVYLTYQNFKINESFAQADGSNRIDANWHFAGGKLSFLPIIFTFGSQDIKFTIGGGGYGRWFSTHVLSTSDDESVALITDELTAERVEYKDYGFHGQIGFQVYRFFFDINMFNQWNHVLRSPVSNNVLEPQYLKLKSFSLNLTYNF